MSNYRIYVDGSAVGNQNVTADTPAGWGFTVVGTRGQTVSHSTGYVVYEAYGPVITNNKQPGWFGAEVGSNNTGELTAILKALQYIESQGPERDYVIFGDSMYAGKMAMSEWKAKENLKLVERTREIWDRLQRLGYSLEWMHIPAHKGHQWNERADHLAEKAAKGEKPEALNDWLE